MIERARRLRGVRGAVITALVLLASTGVAWAFFTSTGSGTATASVSSLSAPTGLTPTSGAGTVSLSWNAVTPPAAGTVKYYVTRSGGAPGGTCPTSTVPAAVTSCSDTGLSAGTYQYTVTAVWKSWTATSTRVTVTVVSGALDHFVVSAPTAATAGSAFTATITGKDSAGNTVTSYTGSQALAFSGPSNSPNNTTPTYPASITFTAGVGSASITLVDAQSTALTATQGSVTGTSGSIVVSAASAGALTVANPGTQTAGTAFSDTITAIDSFGNTATSYAGAKTLTFTGPSNSPGGNTPAYPASVTFTNGVGSASATLVDAETTTLTATQGSLSGTSTSFLVNAASAGAFKVANPGTQTAGSAFSDTITAVDAYGNTASTFTGAQAIIFTGPSNSPGGNTPTYPASVAFTNGSGSASITLVDAQTTTLTATEGPIIGTSGSFAVNAGTAGAYTVANPGTQIAGTAFSDTITAIDGFGNTATNYAGAKTLTFTGPSSSPGGSTPTYPASVTFTAGVGTASITLVDAQTTALTATQGSVVGTSGSFTVNAAAVSKLVITSAPVSGTVSATANLGPITVQEQDSFGNPTTTPETVSLSSTGSTGVFAASQGGSPITTVNIPSGSSTATFWYGNTTAGTPTVTVSKTGLTSGTQQVTVTAAVGLGIVVVSGSGSPIASCGAPSSSYTCNVTGVGNNGSVTFCVTFVNSSGTQTVYSTTQSSTITETGQNSGSVTIAANASSSSPNTLTASHTGNSTKTSTLTFGSYTLAINVSS